MAADLFKESHLLLPRPGSADTPTLPKIDGRTCAGVILTDLPDNAAPRGLRRHELQNLRKTVIDLDGPEAETLVRELAARTLARLEDEKLPYQIRALPAADRPEIKARLESTLKLVRSLPPKRLSWRGSLVRVGAPPLPVSAETFYSELRNARTDFGGDLDIRIRRTDRRGTLFQALGPLDPDAGPTMASHFKMNTANLVAEAPARIAAAMATSEDPLAVPYALANLKVRFIDARTLELSAAGIEPSLLNLAP